MPNAFGNLENALNLLEASDILGLADVESIRVMLKKKEEKEKEGMVLSRHLNKNGKPYRITEVHYEMRGKPVIKWATSAPWKGKTAKVLKNSYVEVIDELYQHYFPDHDHPEDMTLQNAFEKWIEGRKKTKVVSSMTIVHNEADWNHYLAGKKQKNHSHNYERCSLLDKRIADISAAKIRTFYEELTGDCNITKKTFNNIRGLILGSFSYAFNEGVPCIDASRVSTDGLHFMEPKDNSDEVFTPEERDKLLTYVEKLPQDCYTLSVRLAFTLCIRISELRALTWEDVDYSNPERPVMRIRHQIVDKEIGDIHRKATDVAYMKSHSVAGKRSFPLSEYALEVLSELHRINPEGKYICSNKGGRNPVYTNKFNEHLKKYCEGAGIPYRSSHKIRFYAVSQMYDMGMAEKDIMALAGHSNVSTTRHYNRRLKNIDMNDEQLKVGFGR